MAEMNTYTLMTNDGTVVDQIIAPDQDAAIRLFYNRWDDADGPAPAVGTATMIEGNF